MNESQAKVNYYINHRSRVHDIVNMRQREIMNNSIFEEYELYKIS